MDSVERSPFSSPVRSPTRSPVRSPIRSPVRSPGKGKRLSIASINPEFEAMSVTNRSRSPSPTKLDFRKSLGKVFGRNWPPATLRQRAEEEAPKSFTIRMNSTYREIAQSNNPEEHFNEAVKYLGEIQDMQKKKPETKDKLVEDLQDDMIEAVFGSNAIENVGGSIRITYRLCRSIFAGEITNMEAIAERDEEYAEELAHLAATQRAIDTDSVIRSRREIVQHAAAMKYIIDALVIRNERLSEHIIKETHRILMMYSEHQDIGGVYRDTEEAASHGLRLETDQEYGKRVKDAKRLKPDRAPPERQMKPLFFSKFVRGASVPLYMKQMVATYDNDIDNAEATGEIDPMNLAAKYCNHLVCIHPFQDGNGRLCRLLMNAILLKYAGACIPIGVEVQERDNYIEQAFNANKLFTKEDQDDVDWDQRTSHKTLRGMIVEKMSVRMSKVWERLRS